MKGTLVLNPGCVLGCLGDVMIGRLPVEGFNINTILVLHCDFNLQVKEH